MQAKTMIPVLLLIAVAGCARSADPAGAANTSVPAADTATPAQAEAPAPTPPVAPGPQSNAAPPRPADPARAGADADGTEGIRVGEPAPGEPRGPHQPAPGTAWHAFGNEPFWSVQARGGTLVFTTPEDQRGVTLLGRRVPSLVGTVILGSGPKGEFHLGVTPGKCSDGMSDRTHAYTSTFIYGGTTYQGCAEPVDAR